MTTTYEQHPLWDDLPTPQHTSVEDEKLNNPSIAESAQKKTNPCIAMYGPYRDEDVRCKDCDHLVSIVRNRPVYKCEMRENTHSARTDHRLSWPACARFEERIGEMPMYDGRS